MGWHTAAVAHITDTLDNLSRQFATADLNDATVAQNAHQAGMLHPTVSTSTVSVRTSHSSAHQANARLERERFTVATMSGAGPALFAFGRPDGEETAAAFATRLAEECTEAAGVNVRVWPARFTAGPQVLRTTLESAEGSVGGAQ